MSFNVEIALAPRPHKGAYGDLYEEKEQKSTRSAATSPEQLLNDFLSEWDTGLAIFDEQLRYQAVNPWLAERNGLAAELHVGKHVNEVMGEVGAQIETALKAALISGQPIVNFEPRLTLPARLEGKRWIVSVFPSKDAHGTVKQIAAIFLETIAEPSRGATARSSPNPELLRSWKDIANYMGTCVKTVQRWERLYALPVRRVSSSKGAVVFALRSELEQWMLTASSKVKSLSKCSNE